MPTTFAVADTHIFHYNIALHCNREPWIYDNPKYDPSKPYHFKYNNPKAVHLESHDQALINNWNSVVSKKDEVWFLGDLAWKNHIQYILALNGTKYLIRGNHDKMDLNSLRSFSRIGDNQYHYSYYAQIYGRRVMLSHCPYETWFSSCHGSWHLHGHCHGRLPERVDLLRFDVGVDAWGYYPVPWEIIEAKMTEKERLKKEYFAFKGQNIREEDEDTFETNETASNKRIEKEAGESMNNFYQTRTKNIELMKKFGVISEKTIKEEKKELCPLQAT